jgi:hypothetical protein
MRELGCQGLVKARKADKLTANIPDICLTSKNAVFCSPKSHSGEN